MATIVLPTIYVRNCAEVTALADKALDCLELQIGELKIIIFNDAAAIPVIREIKERETL